jgi:non-ribosomal peptide synthetase component E (peptide arylation enzyme)
MIDMMYRTLVFKRHLIPTLQTILCAVVMEDRQDEQSQRLVQVGMARINIDSGVAVRNGGER